MEDTIHISLLLEWHLIFGSSIAIDIDRLSIISQRYKSVRIETEYYYMWNHQHKSWANMIT